jgi:hypothetical protein
MKTFIIIMKLEKFTNIKKEPMWTRQASMRMAMLWQLVENHELGALHFKKYILGRLGGTFQFFTAANIQPRQLRGYSCCSRLPALSLFTFYNTFSTCLGACIAAFFVNAL